ncbi:MAG TPA: hypothetical protein VJB69_01025 [Candidatus Paceibacterota bacterium]
MRLHHTERLTESVARLTAEFLGRRRDRNLVTVSGARLDRAHHSAIIFLTVYPESAAGQTLVEVKKWRRELRDFLDERLRGSSLTHVNFALDESPALI